MNNGIMMRANPKGLNIRTLEESGISDTRINDLYKAASEVHYAVSTLDKNNLKTLKNKFPEILNLAQAFGKGHPFYNKFEI